MAPDLRLPNDHQGPGVPQFVGISLVYFMKYLISYLVALLMVGAVAGQADPSSAIASLQRQYQGGQLSDTAFINAMNRLGAENKDLYTDTVIAMQERMITLARQVGYGRGEAEALRVMAIALDNKRKFDASLQYLEQALAIAKKGKYKEVECKVLNNIGGLYIHWGNYTEALQNFLQALKIAEAGNDPIMLATILNNMANSYFFRGQLDDAEATYFRTLEIARHTSDSFGIMLAYNNLGELFLEKKNYGATLVYADSALYMNGFILNNELMLASTITKAAAYSQLDSVSLAIRLYENALASATALGDVLYQARAMLGLSKLRFDAGKWDQALDLAQRGTGLAESIDQKQIARDGHELLTIIHEAMGNGLLALKHHRMYKAYADSLYNIASERAAATMQADHEFSKKELVFERKNLQQRWIIFSAFAGLLSVGLIALLVTRKNARIKQVILELNLMNQEREQQRASLETALTSLKATQEQLIHAEKMASLGELTSGIAHEIQNPLNFVNNFSEVSKELAEEMKDEIALGNYEEVKAIADDISGNLEKILNHGKRADGIVKSMLFHSRTSAGRKEPTNINDLAEEYLKLSYHGMRARDKAFHASYQVRLAKDLPPLKVIPQDIGRVLLNLFNNAFYAVTRRYEEEGNGYKPQVQVHTRRNDTDVEIVVEDNGTGIPQDLLSKIFQPFFTTKPTGVGTGLGLSISYDIVTKGHGGELLVTSDPGHFTQFTIRLPIAET
ncbi:MAG TPA: tetratricopeptide repeat protein [Phnomibacter sp.]|nr:tetratricopeptide repeat protein [Phnomibacter sp.]